MENASKALIIAGAILLSILIIALGMRIYNSSSSVTGGADLSAQEISSHNAQFEAYEGRQKGTQVKTLLNAIEKNNTEYTDRTIEIDKGTITEIKSTTTYDVSFTYEGHDGLINTCTIKVYGT